MNAHYLEKYKVHFAFTCKSISSAISITRVNKYSILQAWILYFTPRNQWHNFADITNKDYVPISREQKICIVLLAQYLVSCSMLYYNVNTCEY